MVHFQSMAANKLCSTSLFTLATDTETNFRSLISDRKFANRLHQSSVFYEKKTKNEFIHIIYCLFQRR